MCISATSGIATAHPNFSPDAIPAEWSDSESANSIEEESLGIRPLSFKGSGGPGTCRLVVWDAGWDRNTNWLGVQGGRENCQNSGRFTVELRKNVSFLPDPILGTTTGEGNSYVRAYGACQGAGKYYGRVTSTNGTVLRGDDVGSC